MKQLLLLLISLMGATASNDILAGTPIEQCSGQRLECPDFTLVAVNEGYETRRYPASKWVCTRHRGDEPIGSPMYSKLFDYISGSNDQGLKIPMTAPVTTIIEPGVGPNCDNNFTMCFFVPTAFWGNTPKPTDRTVFLSDSPEVTLYVKAYSGHATTIENIAKSQELIEALGNTPVEESKWITYGYDSPFKLRNRRNEVAIIAK